MRVLVHTHAHIVQRLAVAAVIHGACHHLPEGIVCTGPCPVLAVQGCISAVVSETVLHYVHRTGKGQFSFQSQRKTMSKNIQTTAQLHSSHTLAK